MIHQPPGADEPNSPAPAQIPEPQFISPAHAHALSYASLGVVVAPMWGGMKMLHASRARPERALLGGSFDLATVGSLDPAIITSWYERDPGAGVAIICGMRSRLFVVDVDPRNGGDQFWEAWLGARAQEGYILPDDLPMVASPRGGYQYWVRLPVGRDVRNATLGLNGVDILGSEHWAGAPPSAVEGVGGYSWTRAGTLQEVPWLLEMMQPRRRGRTQTEREFIEAGERVDLTRGFNGEVPPGEQHDYLVSVAASLRARRTAPSVALDILRQIVANFENGNPEKPWKPEDADEIWAWATSFPEGVDEGENRRPIPAWRPFIIQGGEPNENGELEPQQVQVINEVGNRPSDLANAEDLARLFEGQLMWTPQLGWHIWDGRRWRLDEGVQVHARVTELSRVLRQRALATPNDDRDILVRRVARLESVGGMKSCLEAAQHLLELDAARLDENPELLNFPNGTLDLRTGDLRAPDPRDHLTRLAGCDYDPGATSDKLEEFWQTFLPETYIRDAFMELLGATLIGGNRGRLLILVVGQTTTGKSQLFEGVRGALGEYFGIGSPSLFRGSMTEAGRPELLSLLTRRMVVLEEAGGSWELHADRVKLLTGGVPLSVRALFSNRVVSRVPDFTPVIVSNEVPMVRGADDALARRLVAVEMNRRLAPEVERPEIRAAWTADEGVRQALAAQLLGGLFRVQERGGVIWGEGGGWDIIRGWSAQAFSQVDDAVEFVNELIEEGKLRWDAATPACSSLKTGDLHDLYCRWVNSRGDSVARRDRLSAKQFKRRLETLGWLYVKSNGPRWDGWELVGGGSGVPWQPQL